MEGYTEQRVAETTGTETEGEACACANYYPGMLADIEDKLLERQEIMYEQEFFSGSECFDVGES